MSFGRNPTGPMTILEPPDQAIGEFYVVQKRRVSSEICEKVGRVKQSAQPVSTATTSQQVAPICFGFT